MADQELGPQTAGDEPIRVIQAFLDSRTPEKDWKKEELMACFECSGDDFVPGDIRAETIRELEKIVTTSSGCKIFEYDFWK